MRILVCLPTYNEEENIEHMVSLLKKYQHEFIISDGQSTDKTVAIAKQLNAKVLERSGHGKGYAVKDSLQYASENNFDGLALLDCDRTYHVEDLNKLISEFATADMVVGCRNFSDIDFLRRIANYLMTGFTNLVFQSNMKDMATGMRILRVEKFLGKINAQSFDVEPQMHGVALREKMKIVEVNISYSERTGESKIGIRHFFLILYRILKERFQR